MSQYNVAEDVSSAGSHGSAAAYVHSRPGPDCGCVCVHSQGLTVWRQCQWLDVCACAGPVADCWACMTCALIKGLKDH